MGFVVISCYFKVQIGADVSSFKVGDKVFGRSAKSGSFGEYLAIGVPQVCIMPNNLSFEEAAAVPLAAATAYQSLVTRGKYKPNHRVFVTGGAGGVGTYALQICRALATKANDLTHYEVATTASAQKIDLVKSLGATTVVDYKKESFQDILHDYDIVFDTTAEQSKALSCTKNGGLCLSISVPFPTATRMREVMAEKGGILSYVVPAFLAVANVGNSIRAAWNNVSYDYLLLDNKTIGEDLKVLSEFFENGTMKSVIDSVHEFKDTPKAMEKARSGRATGKVIIKMI